tara:strand:+ start:89598 stop:89729 length:132 start_codon:yes stop_codon:yes gene_type:complete
MEKIQIMEAIYLIVSLVVYILGVATGIYWSSQIEKDIDNRTKK